jgi:hypothetical protein
LIKSNLNQFSQLRIHSEYQRRVGGGGKREMVENHKVDRGEGEGRRENLGERRRRKKRDGIMENWGRERCGR